MGRLRNRPRPSRYGSSSRQTQSAIELTRQCQQAGDWKQAEALCRGILEVQPQHLESLYLLSVASLHSGKPQEAAELLGRAIGNDPSCAIFHGQMGNVLQALGKPQEAVASYRRALALAPRDPDHYNNLGNVLRELGRMEEAAECYRLGLQFAPQHAPLHNNLANVLKDRGELDKAIECYQQALRLRPEFVEALLNLANALKQQERLAEAAEAYEKLLEIRPDLAPALMNFGVVLQDQGSLAEAVHYYEKVIALDPRLAPALNNLGNILRLQGKLTEAANYLERALEVDPNFMMAHNNLGTVLLAQDRQDDALRSFERAIELAPDNAQAYNNAGNVHCSQERFDRALECYERARALEPDFAEVYNNLGNVRRALNEFDQAEDLYRHGLALKPEFPDAYNNLGNTLKDLGRFAEAVAAYEKAIELTPDNPGYRWNKALAELTCGDLERGWVDYEAGFGCKQRQPERPFSQPRWQGESLTGKTILAWAEQGVGDEIMFANSIPDLAEMADHCVVECDHRLVPLFARSFPDCEVIPKTNPPQPRTAWPDIDVQSPMGSLPRWLRPSVDRFPQGEGYLMADPARVDYWRERLAALGTDLKVGISWRSRVMTANRLKLCVPLDQWDPILQTPGVQFINLQYCSWEEDLAEAERRLGVHVHHFEELNLKDELDDVAALVTALDLSITISNIFMTLGGALNAETWVFAMKDHMDWLTLGTDYAPWFPSVRLWYRTWRETWKRVVDAMASELRERAKK